MSAADWLQLPNGNRLYLPPLRARERPGCPCGETVFTVGEPGQGVSCLSCVKRRTAGRCFGKVDMATLRVVADFTAAAPDAPGGP